jgi:hypothetical protein
MVSLFESPKEKEIRENCKGLYWRAEVSSYCYEGRIGVKKTLKLLKRKSCKGCEQCGWVQEFLNEDVFNDPEIDYLADIEHGKMYTYSASSYKGPYDLYADDIEIEFIEVKEDKNDKNKQ